MKFGYKLVRDRIPDIITKRGEDPVIAFLTQKSLPVYLKAKLVEEALEVQTAPADELVEELADVFEVLLTLAAKSNITKKEIEQVRRKKRKERGGFEKGILLKC